MTKVVEIRAIVHDFISVGGQKMRNLLYRELNPTVPRMFRVNAKKSEHRGGVRKQEIVSRKQRGVSRKEKRVSVFADM